MRLAVEHDLGADDSLVGAIAPAIEELGDRVRFTILCTSDPDAVSGLAQSFGRLPDLVAGPATSTRAGADLVEKLSGVPSTCSIPSSGRPA